MKEFVILGMRSEASQQRKEASSKSIFAVVGLCKADENNINKSKYLIPNKQQFFY